MPLRSQLLKAVQTAEGSIFTIKKTITSSDITTSAQALTSVANGGELLIEQIIVKTDATGLAGGTNFVIATDNAKGTVNNFVETVANLGANITLVLSGGAIQAETTTSDAHPTVTSCPTVLEAGKKLTFNNTGSVGTGAGTIDVYVTFRRLSAGVTIRPA